MALDSEPDRIQLLSDSLKKEANETLFLEFALREYDLSRLRDNEVLFAKAEQNVTFLRADQRKPRKLPSDR